MRKGELTSCCHKFLAVRQTGIEENEGQNEDSREQAVRKEDGKGVMAREAEEEGSVRKTREISFFPLLNTNSRHSRNIEA